MRWWVGGGGGGCCEHGRPSARSRAAGCGESGEIVESWTLGQCDFSFSS
jgi:hypothetical protein